jgi:hypothetical protein
MTAAVQAPAQTRGYAKVEWDAEDVMGLNPGMTAAEAGAFMASIEGDLIDVMIEAGWDRIHAGLEKLKA